MEIESTTKELRVTTDPLPGLPSSPAAISPASQVSSTSPSVAGRSLKDIKLPNVRKLFVPDTGKILVDCDLSGADAQVVAWEAEDEDLKTAFRAGLNVHNHNGTAMWGDAYAPNKKLRHHTMRDELKRAVHGTNYGASARTLAITLGWSIAQATEFQRRWLKELHPGIGEWHDRTYYMLQTTRTVTNRFGYRIVYFDRPDSLLPEALAWTPQSTVAICCSRGAVRLSRISWVDVLLQVHDSVVFQIPFHRLDSCGLVTIRDALTVQVPYSDPLTIPWDIAVSEKSWGDVAKIKWEA